MSDVVQIRSPMSPGIRSFSRDVLLWIPALLALGYSSGVYGQGVISATHGSASSYTQNYDGLGTAVNANLDSWHAAKIAGNSSNVSVTGTAASGPSLDVSTNNLTGFSTFSGKPSTNQSFTAGGSNLVTAIILTASNGYEISTDQTNFGTTIMLGGSGGSDNAANYTTSPTWTNGANAGSGFLPWAITANTGTGGSSGAFIGNPASAGIGTNATFGTNAFGLFANPTNSGNFVEADRSFRVPLAVGQTFSFQWGINWDSGSVGSKGFIIYSGEPAGTNEVINVSNAGSSNVTFNGTNTGLAFGTNVMTWSFTLFSSNTITVSATGRDGSGSFTTNLTGISAPKSVRFYARQLPPNSDNRQPYFNNFLITAPPSVPPTTIYVRVAATNAANSSLLGGVGLVSGSASNSVALSGKVEPRRPSAGEPVVGFAAPSADGAVACVAPADGGNFYVGGAFSKLIRADNSKITTNRAPGLARVLSNGMVDTNFAPPTNEIGGGVLAINPSMDGATLLAGGTFTNFGGQGMSGLVLLSNTGALMTNFNPGFTGSVKINAIARQHDGMLLVGGLFTKTLTNAGGTNLILRNLARLHPTNGTIDATFLPNPNGEIAAIAIQKYDGRIVIGGTFATVDGISRNNLARLLPTKISTNQTSFVDTGFVTGSGPDGPVQAVSVLDDGSVVVGGSFFGYNNTTFYNNLIKLGTNGALDPAFNFSGRQGQGGFSGQVTDIQIRPTGEIFTAGAFTSVSHLTAAGFTNQPAGRVFQLLANGDRDLLFGPGAGANNTVFGAAQLANGNIAIVGSFTLFSGIALQNIAVLIGYDDSSPVVLTSPRFLRVDAGQKFSLPFTASETQLRPVFALTGVLPDGVRFATNNNTLTGIALEAGRWTNTVQIDAGEPEPFEIVVEPKIVPYGVWQQAWEEMSVPAISLGGPDSKAGNPSGLSNFMIYALSGGDPRRESAAILPQPLVSLESGVAKHYLTGQINLLAATLFTPEYAAEPGGPWQIVPPSGVTLSPDGLFMLMPPFTAGNTKQFMRLRIEPQGEVP